MNENQEDAVRCPSILFRLNGGLYCVDSHFVSTIMELPATRKPLPDTPPYITGIFPYRGGSVTMFDLRAALKQPSLAKEYDDFCQMLDARKQDHVNWVNALERTIRTGEPFTLTTDPHKCALGVWYDNFKTDSSELTFQLNKLDKPHQLLHAAAKEVERCDAHSSEEEVRRCKDAVYRKIHDVYMKQIMGVLDETKNIFRSRTFHEMVLVLSGERSLGLVVDEVLSVDIVSEELQGAQHQLLSYSPYITRIVKSEKYDELILELSVSAILGATERDGLFSAEA